MSANKVQRPASKRVGKRSKYIYGNPLRTIVLGTLGSLLMMVGSFGVGWLADASPLQRIPFVISLRYNISGIILCIILLAVGGMIMCREWLRLSQKLIVWRGNAKRYTWLAIVCWTTPQLIAFPLFSRDIFSYFAQGRVMLSGQNPYEVGVSSINNFFQYGADPLWAQSPPPYGPIFLWIEQGVAWLAGTNVDLGIYLFRGVAVFGVALIAYFVPKIAALHNINGVRALWLVVANPLFIAQFVTAGHNDALMTGFAVAGTYFAAAHRNWKGGIFGITLVTLAIAVKPIALVILPFIGLLWAGRGASWPRKFMFWALTLTVSLAELGIMGLINGFGFGWVGALSTTGGQLIWYAPVGFIAWMAGMIFTPLLGGETAETIRDAIGSMGKLIGMLGAVLVMFVGQDSKLVRRIGISLGCIVIFAPMIQSWYLLWIIPFLAASGIRTDWQLDFYFITTLFFMIYAVSDQLDVSPYIQDFDMNMGRLIAVVISLAYASYLVFIDPATRRVLRRGKRSSIYQVII